MTTTEPSTITEFVDLLNEGDHFYEVHTSETGRSSVHTVGVNSAIGVIRGTTDPAAHIVNVTTGAVGVRNFKYLEPGLDVFLNKDNASARSRELNQRHKELSLSS